MPLAENTVDPATAHCYDRIDLIFRSTDGQELLELGMRLTPWLLERIEQDSPTPGPTVFRAEYGPMEGYLLRLRRISESPVAYYRTVFFMVECRAV